ncbi:hypothetical protein [Psychrobacillus soli]|uniref:Uncharacterized protein n=1 Tax=Psychrobacillus soli TaxID=1543965 RepID=A0A544TIM1_9BACI|nr:hypothetical protein [Psychrobacillus soli]TQR17294.1 hypothetical protein FG383_05930 [Psychrobacillus soli]
MTKFPIIQTNIWDSLWAAPIIIVLTEILKVMLPIRSQYISTIATAIGLIISIFISHPHDLSAGISMGFFYSGAAIGSYSSIKTSLTSYRNRA